MYKVKKTFEICIMTTIKSVTHCDYLTVYNTIQCIQCFVRYHRETKYKLYYDKSSNTGYNGTFTHVKRLLHLNRVSSVTVVHFK